MYGTMRLQKGSEAGQALLLTAFFVFLLFTLALGYFKILPAELNAALKSKQMITAQVVCEAGVKEAAAWIRSQPPHRVLDQAVLNAEFNASVEALPIELGEHWDYTVRLDVNNDGPHLYDVLATARFDGRPQREARATVTRESFAQYALFIDRWGEGFRYVMQPDFVRGPFHTNDFFQVASAGETFWDGETPSFVSGNRARMTFARPLTGDNPLGWTGDGNGYYGVGSASGPSTPNNDASLVPYNESGAIDSRYDKMIEGGRANLRAVEHVDLPYSAAALRFAALDQGGSNPPFNPPSDVGVYLPQDGSEVTGGIYVVGNADITMSVTGSKNQVHEITQIIPEEAYYFEETMTRPRIVMRDVWQDGPVTVPIYGTSGVPVTKQRQVGTETRTRTVTERFQTGVRIENVGGMTREVPVYDTRTRTENYEVPVYESYTDYEDRNVIIGYEEVEGRYVRVPVQEGTEEYQQGRYLDPDTYEANPGAYPGAFMVELPGGPKTAKVIEVTEGHEKLGGESASAGHTLFQDFDGKVHRFEGSLNGVTYVDGNVNLRSSVVKGALRGESSMGSTYEGRYVLANPDAGRTVNIRGDLLSFYDGGQAGLQEPGRQNVLRRGETHPTGQHGLGIVAENVYVDPQSTAPIDVHAVILAGRGLTDGSGEPSLGSDERPRVRGGFGASPAALSSGRLYNFRLVGGLIQANAYLWNEGFGSGGSQGITGPMIYDQSVADNLIRFPMTANVLTLRYADRSLSQAAHATNEG